MKKGHGADLFQDILRELYPYFVTIVVALCFIGMIWLGGSCEKDAREAAEKNLVRCNDAAAVAETDRRALERLIVSQIAENLKESP